MNSIIESANFFEFANSLDDLILEILYDSNKGYINTISKEAITQAQDKINYFDENTFKLIEEYKISNAENLIKEKRETLLSVIRKHYQEQALIWCDEIYRNCIENCKTLIAINRDNPEIADKNFQKALALINWISSIKNLNQKEQNILLDDFNRELGEGYLIIFSVTVDIKIKLLITNSGSISIDINNERIRQNIFCHI